MSGIGATVYLCNPELNTKCTKTGCGYIHEDGPCFRTTNPEYAEVFDNGQPIEATEEDVERWGKNIPSQHQVKHDKKGGCNGDYCEL